MNPRSIADAMYDYVELADAARRELAEAIQLVALAKQNYDLVKAEFEQRLVDEHGEKGLGSNAETRARRMTIELSQNADVQRALNHLEEAEKQVTVLRNELARINDMQRVLEYTIRAMEVENGAKATRRPVTYRRKI